MKRMDKYNDETEEKKLSRTEKNQELYKEVYLNNSLVDLNSILDDIETIDDPIDKTKEFKLEEIEFIGKNYDINEFIENKRKDKVSDNLKREINNEIEIIDNEINSILENINKVEKQEDFFSDLLPDNENTIITEATEQTQKLDQIVSDTVLDNFVMNKELNETHSFMDLDETQIENKKTNKKSNTLPLVLCIGLFIILILVVLYIIFV